MGNYNRDDRGGGRSFGGRGGGGRGFSARGGSAFGGGGDRGGFGGGRGFDRRSSDRPMFKAICSNCDKECEVPFRPTGAKPVFCSECFEKRSREAGHSNFSDRGPRPSNFENRGGGESQSGELSAISAKLDKIITLLTPSVPVEAPQVEKAKGPESFDPAQDHRPVEGEKPKKKVTKKKKA